ncbi:MAG: DMT family transporter [Candidatus Eisenbacteria bacterium]|uniref:DMT family transporter n=1 Tax=Eiseniibacteriota bacterium TaxID=2212470 RepID=A0A7Y2EBI0_UNCEI|nr:DMT family transporter [Candidatus Eisenbacteria bacterium]
MIGAAFFFSLMSLFVKIAGRRLPTSEIVFARSFLSLIITFFLMRRAGVWSWGQNKPLLILRGVAGFCGLLCFFYAITKLPLADVTVIHFINPVLTAVLAGAVLGERVSPRDAMGLGLSLVGVIFVAQPEFLFGGAAEELNLFAVGVALCGAVCSAIAYTTVRKLRETEHHLTVVFYFPLVATPASLPLLQNAVWPTPFEWVILVLIGIVTQIAQIFLTKGLHVEKAGRAMSMSYIQIVFAVTWGFLFFQEVPNLMGIVGAVLVLMGTLVTTSSKPRPV